MGETFHWLDVERIGEELDDAFPEVDPLTVTFPKLREMVRQLEDFQEQSGHPANERILEAIQQAWLEERGDMEGNDLDETR